MVHPDRQADTTAAGSCRRPLSSSAASMFPPQNQTARQRKWHPRVFTGCVDCRRRHVKCDEKSPACSNCTRLGFVCNFNRKFVSKSLPSLSSLGGPLLDLASVSALSPDSSSPSSKSPSTNSSGINSSNANSSNANSSNANSSNANSSNANSSSAILTMSNRLSTFSHMGYTVSATPSSTGRSYGTTGRCFVLEHRPAPVSEPAPNTLSLSDPSAHIDCNQTLYFRHFLDTVSSYLIIYDTPSNSNPFRMLPQLAGRSGLLQDTMKALGAMHLSGLVVDPEQQHVHRSAAVKTYGSIVTRLRAALYPNQCRADLELLATSLLLCMFEKMSSNDASWKIHLVGARQIFQTMYSPRALSSDGNCADTLGISCTLPLRRFLVSLMSYLDVAAACATGECPLIAGDYWETLGGGWEYNLGVPSISTVRTPADRTMAQLRHSWSRVMCIQMELSSFAKTLRMGLDERRKKLMHGDLVYRIKNWHDSAPDIFLVLEDLDKMPASAADEEVEALTAAACIQCYALACKIYLERIVTRRIGSAAFDAEIKAAVDRILTLISNFSSGLNQLAILWPFLTAGIATADVKQQALLRSWLMSMKRFGFNHVSRVLDTLEYGWRHMRLYGGVNYDSFEAMICSNLVP